MQNIDRKIFVISFAATAPVLKSHTRFWGSIHKMSSDKLFNILNARVP